MANSLIPITILTGFLGAGKTSSLKRYLESQVADSVAVIINEYGSTQIDGSLVSFAGDIAALKTTNGCLCCTISGDVRDALKSLSVDIEERRLVPFDQLVIETTGLADPMSLVHALTTDPSLSETYFYDRTVTVVDALRGEYWIEKYEECRRQIQLADTVLISKTDLIEDPISRRELDQLKVLIGHLNPIAEISNASDCRSSELLNPTQSSFVSGSLIPKQQHRHAHQHSHDMSTFTVTIPPKMPIDVLEANLTALGERLGRDLLRVKGFIFGHGSTQQDTLVQGVGGQFQFTTLASTRVEQSELVFITNAIEEDEAAIEILGGV